MRPSRRSERMAAAARRLAAAARRSWLARRAASEDGSASLEFLTLGVLLLVPLAYLAVCLASIQSAALAAEGAARHAGRILADGAASEEAIVEAEAAIAFALADHGFGLEDAEVELGCLPAGSRCTAASELVAVEVTVHAPLPFIPDGFDLAGRATIPVSATSSFPMGRFDGGAP